MEAEFPGREEVKKQLGHAVVRTIDDYGSLEIKGEAGSAADVSKTVPVEAEAPDSDGVPVYYLLHVADGRAVELEVYKADLTDIKRSPEPNDLSVIVLPG